MNPHPFGSFVEQISKATNLDEAAATRLAHATIAAYRTAFDTVVVDIQVPKVPPPHDPIYTVALLARETGTDLAAANVAVRILLARTERLAAQMRQYYT